MVKSFIPSSKIIPYGAFLFVILSNKSRPVFDAVVEAAGSAAGRDIELQIGARHALTPAGIGHIRHAIGSLHELGVLHEQ